MASNKETPYGVKRIEVRSWIRRTLLPGTPILIHTSSSHDYDHWFEPLGISLSDAPKFSIIGVATFQGCRSYFNKELWDRDRKDHCWLGDADWRAICQGYGCNPVGHVFSHPILFSEPILDVPGDRAYWRPNPKKSKQFERQQQGFEKAISILNQLKYVPEPHPIDDYAANQPGKRKSKPNPNRITVVFGSHSIGFISNKAVWDIDNPSPEFVAALKQEAEFFSDDHSKAWLYKNPEEVKALLLKKSV
jgi:hypothetical protein